MFHVFGTSHISRMAYLSKIPALCGDNLNQLTSIEYFLLIRPKLNQGKLMKTTWSGKIILLMAPD